MYLKAILLKVLHDQLKLGNTVFDALVQTETGILRTGPRHKEIDSAEMLQVKIYRSAKCCSSVSTAEI